MIESLSRRAVVPEELAGQRLDRIAAELWPDCSRSRLKQWIEAGDLTVDGTPARPKARLKGGESLALEAVVEPAVRSGPEDIPLAIVYEDEHLIVIDKPAGLVVHPGAGNREGTLVNALLHHDETLERLPRAGLVHRLDKDTSGLLLVARTPAAHLALTRMLERREIRRTYRAVCQTVFTGGGVVDAPIERNPRDRTRMAVREGGRPARTYYRLIERFRAHSLIELELDTGRTHQIRVHMAHIRSPVVGDPVYGGRPRLPRDPGDALIAALRAFRRQALHAVGLTFTHPGDDRELKFTSELPEDMTQLIAVLREDRERHAA